ncbi:DUF4156 domain-containing protein [Spirochaetota bacterium]
MKKILFGLFVMIFVVGCVTGAKKLTQLGEKVKISKQEPPSGCKEIGSVTGDSIAFGSHYNSIGENVKLAKIRLRNNAAAEGANYVVLETNNQRDKQVTLGGTAYKCPNK